MEVGGVRGNWGFHLLMAEVWRIQVCPESGFRIKMF